MRFVRYMPMNGLLHQAYERSARTRAMMHSHSNHCRVTYDDFVTQIFAGFLLIQYSLSCRSTRDSAALLICIFYRCNVPLDEFGVNSETSITEHRIVHHVRLRKVPAIACVLVLLLKIECLSANRVCFTEVDARFCKFRRVLVLPCCISMKHLVESQRSDDYSPSIFMARRIVNYS